MNVKLAFSFRFKDALKEKGWDALTHKELSKKLPVSAPQISNYKTGAKVPAVDNGVQIAIILDVNFEWLMTGRGEMKYSGDYVKEERKEYLHAKITFKSPQSEANFKLKDELAGLILSVDEDDDESMEFIDALATLVHVAQKKIHIPLSRIKELERRVEQRRKKNTVARGADRREGDNEFDEIEENYSEQMDEEQIKSEQFK